LAMLNGTDPLENRLAAAAPAMEDAASHLSCKITPVAHGA
jgi:hypothetical protein